MTEPTEVNVRFLGTWRRSEIDRIVRVLKNTGVIESYHIMADSIGIPGIRITITRKPDGGDILTIPEDSHRLREGDGFLVNTALTLILNEIGGIAAQVRELTPEDKIEKNV